MITCPSCKKTHVDNTIFCSECGAYLLEEDGFGGVTDAVGIKVSELAAPIDEPLEDEALAEQGTGPLGINLRIGEKRREIQVPLSKPVHMGRLDPVSKIFPEIDLTNDGGAEKGVSRRHARIMKRGHRIFIEDLASSNGTFVNGQKLTPYFPEALSNGDNLRLGKLEIEVNLS